MERPARGPGRGAGDSARIHGRLADIDWRRVANDLDRLGHARLPGLLAAGECAGLEALFDERGRFRSHIDLDAHRYGEAGGYRYFAYPLPPLVQALRSRLYGRLVPIARSWRRRLGLPESEDPPRSHRRFLERGHHAGQIRPTPLLLRYEEGGMNYLHQDRYGEVGFPLQVVCLLSRPGADFEGGEFLLASQRPRQAVGAEALPLAQGEGLVFPGAERPVPGRRGWMRARTRHGVSRVRRGRRTTLGILFQDAR